MNFSIVQKIAIWVIPVLFAITVHEVAHGWVAERFGDPTARRLGRLTLNPIKHIDPLGTVVLPLTLLLLTGFVFGWAKPVPVTYQNLHNPKRDMAYVALAGPGANLIMALFWALVARLAVTLPSIPSGMSVGFAYMGVAGININIVLMVLNLLPIPPLDGSRVLMALLPNRASYGLMRMEPYGFMILVLLLVTGILGKLIGPPIQAMISGIARLLGIF